MKTLTITAGKTFTDETIDDSDLNAAATPTASLADGSIEPEDIDSALYKHNSLTLSSSATTTFNCIPGRTWQQGKLDITQNTLIEVHGLENGMMGAILILADTTGYQISFDSTDFTDILVSAATYYTNSTSARMLITFNAVNDNVYWGQANNLS